MRGFTLIETVLYIGIFSLILVIVLPTFYFVSSSLDKEKNLILESEEASFILGKLNRLISDSIKIIEPVKNQTGSVLKIQLDNLASDPVIFGLENQSIFIQRGVGTFKENLNSERVIISNLIFSHIEGGEYLRPSVGVSFQINSRTIPTSTIEISNKGM